MAIVPPFIPFPRTCVIISGIFEILGGIGLLLPRCSAQKIAGWGLALLLVAVFPANIYMAAAHIQIHGFRIHPWMSWTRLALQPLLIAAVLWVTRIFST